jgi:hypothetical protein
LLLPWQRIDSLGRNNFMPFVWQYQDVCTLNKLGEDSVGSGRPCGGAWLFETGLGIKQEIVDKQGIADCLEGFAKIASGRGNAERAAHLYAAAQVLRQSIGASWVSVERAAIDRDVATVHVKLGEAFDAAWSAGCAMTREEAVAYALEQASL